MSENRASGGNAESLGARGSGIGHDTLLGHGEYDQVYNLEESPGPSNPQGDNTTELLDHTIRGVPDLGDNGEAGPHMQGGPVELLQEQPTEAELVVHQSPPPKHMLSSKHYRGTGLP